MAEKKGCVKWGLGCFGVFFLLAVIGAVTIYVNRDAIENSDFMKGVKEGYNEAKDSVKNLMVLGGDIEAEYGVSPNIGLNQ